jgi:hypothetical protein
MEPDLRDRLRRDGEEICLPTPTAPDDTYLSQSADGEPDHVDSYYIVTEVCAPHPRVDPHP